MNYKTTFLLSILLLLAAACGADNPPANGVYLKDGQDYTEIPQVNAVFGKPDHEDLVNFPQAARQTGSRQAGRGRSNLVKVQPRATKVHATHAEGETAPIPTSTPHASAATIAADRISIARNSKAGTTPAADQTKVIQLDSSENAVILARRNEESYEAAVLFGREHFDYFVVFTNGFDCKLPENAFPVIKAVRPLVRDNWQVVEFEELPACTSEQTCFQVYAYANNFIFDYLGDWQSILDANQCEPYESPTVS